jgi:hypothetical protein
VGYYVDLGYLPALEDVLEGVLPQGIILGRVVDADENPVPDAWVHAGGVDAAVYYLSDARTEFHEEAGTAWHGYFIIVGIDGDPCSHTLAAQTFDPPRTGASLAPVALVQNAVTAVVIEVQ